MITIRPISDLRNKFSEIEETVVEENVPVFLTKNGYGTMVLMSLDQYDQLINPIESKLDEADLQASQTGQRFSSPEVFGRVRERIDND